MSGLFDKWEKNLVTVWLEAAGCFLGQQYRCSNPALSFLIFFAVTKQRDPETGQQSLLFQVRARLQLLVSGLSESKVPLHEQRSAGLVK